MSLLQIRLITSRRTHIGVVPREHVHDQIGHLAVLAVAGLDQDEVGAEFLRYEAWTDEKTRRETELACVGLRFGPGWVQVRRGVRERRWGTS